LARAMLGDEINEGDRVKARWDAGRQKLLLEPQGRDQGERAGRAPRKPRKASGATAAPPPPTAPPAEPPQPQVGA
ncbi:MAG: hypothetical protein JWO33_894, partial [Caulobacteraceae bacterium]|nr:hypothetical protein [Caulobacteraceae bacterium]